MNSSSSRLPSLFLENYLNFWCSWSWHCSPWCQWYQPVQSVKYLFSPLRCLCFWKALQMQTIVSMTIQLWVWWTGVVLEPEPHTSGRKSRPSLQDQSPRSYPCHTYGTPTWGSTFKEDVVWLKLSRERKTWIASASLLGHHCCSCRSLSWTPRKLWNANGKHGLRHFWITLKSMDPSPSLAKIILGMVLFLFLVNLVKYSKELVQELLSWCARIGFVWIVLKQKTMRLYKDVFEDRNIDTNITLNIKHGTFGMIALNICFIFSRSILPSGQSSMKPCRENIGN